MDTRDLSIAAMGAALRSGAVTSMQLTQDALSRVKAQDDTLHAFVLMTEDLALSQAARADAECQPVSSGSNGMAFPMRLRTSTTPLTSARHVIPSCG